MKPEFLTLVTTDVRRWLMVGKRRRSRPSAFTSRREYW